MPNNYCRKDAKKEILRKVKRKIRIREEEKKKREGNAPLLINAQDDHLHTASRSLACQHAA
jgi:hypothetical protein